MQTGELEVVLEKNKACAEVPRVFLFLGVVYAFENRSFAGNIYSHQIKKNL